MLVPVMEGGEESGLNLHTLVTGSLCPLLTVTGWSGRAAQTHFAGQELGDASLDGDLPQQWHELGPHSVLCPSSWQMWMSVRTLLFSAWGESAETHRAPTSATARLALSSSMAPCVKVRTPSMQPSGSSTYWILFFLSREDASAKASDATMHGISIML